MKKRLFACFSTANVINIISILKTLPQEKWENYFVYLGRIEDLKTVGALLSKHTNIRQLFNLASNDVVFELPKEKLNATIQIKNFDELYFQFNGADYRPITRKYPKADIYLIEDGLSSYEKHDLTFLFHKQPKAIYIYNYLNGFLPHECRYSNLDYIVINKEKTKEIYKELQSNLKVPYDSNTVIICAQELYNTDLITYQNELRMYIDYVAYLITRGIKVMFKDHPRNTKPFFPAIKHHINSPLITAFPPTNAPIEIFISIQKPKAIISPFSTSMFLASHLFDCPTYTMNFLRYKTQNMVLRIYDYASVLAQTQFKDTAHIVHEKTYAKEPPYTKEIETLLKIKELEFYRTFVSKKEFYQMKKDFLECYKNADLLKKFSIHPVVINIIKNGQYIDLLKCNKLNIQHNSKEFIEKFKTIKTISELKYALSNTIKTIKSAIF